MVEIPIFQDISADTTQSIILDGVKVDIRLLYNVRSEKWTMYANTAENSLGGLILVLDYPIMFRHAYKMPELTGDFVVMQRTEILSEITYDSLGEDVGLFYLNAAELSEWRAGYGI